MTSTLGCAMRFNKGNRFVSSAIISVLILALLSLIPIAGYIALTRPTRQEIPTVVSPIVSLEDRIEQVIDSVVHVANVTQGWQGSGLLISSDIVVTARHVADGGSDFTVTLNNGTKVKSCRALTSKRHDIGFLQLEKSVTGVEFSVRLGSMVDCRLGQQVFALGSPFGEMNRNSVTLGIISRLNCDLEKFDCPKDYGWSATFQTDCPAYPGNSGCPLFTLDGVVRGIIVGGFDDNLVYCVPVDLIVGQISTVQLMFQMDVFEFEQGFVPTVTLTEEEY